MASRKEKINNEVVNLETGEVYSTPEDRDKILNTISIDNTNDFSVFNVAPGAIVNLEEFKNMPIDSITQFYSKNNNDVLSESVRKEVASKLMMLWEVDVTKFEYIIHKLETEANECSATWGETITKQWTELYRLKHAVLRDVSSLIKSPNQTENKSMTIQMSAKDLFKQVKV